MEDENLIKQGIVINTVKAVIFLLLGLGGMVGTFYLETIYAEDQEVEEVEVYQGVNVYAPQNIVPDHGIVRFDLEEDNNEIVELYKDESINEYVFGIESGKMWGNFDISNAKVNFLVGNAVVIPNHAQFELTFEGNTMELSVFGGDVYLAFLEDGVDLQQYHDEYSTIFMNRFLVPQDTRVVVTMSKIDERLKLLLYSKLVKEFKFSTLPSAKKEEEWIIENIKDDQRYIETLRQEFDSNVVFNGEVVGDDFWDEMVLLLSENLTFIPEKREQRVFKNLFGYLDNSIFYYNKGEAELAEENFFNFEILLDELSDSVLETDLFEQGLDERMNQLALYDPGESYYSLHKQLLIRQFQNKDDTFEVVNQFWLDVYKAIDVDDALAEDALDNYYNYFDKAVLEITDLETKRHYLSFQNQLFDNLFLRYPVFYKDKYFAIKLVLENSLLKLYDEGQLKDELKQSFVSNKITFLKRLRKFFFDGELSVDQTRMLLSRLIRETEDYLEDDRSEAAVVEFFESELEDIGDFWGYLNAPEYYSSSIYGLSHRERYATFVAENEQIWSFIDVQEDLDGEEVATDVDLDDIELEIQNMFRLEERITQLTIGEIQDVNQRYVEVSGNAGGYDFTAVYDRASIKVKDIYARDELVADRAVTIESIVPLLDKRFGDFAEEVESEEVTEETNAQRIAKIYIADQIAAAGFKATPEVVTVLDDKNALYRVADVILEGYPDILFSFDYDATSEMSSNIYMVVRGKPVVINEEYSLSQLRDLAFSQSEFAGEIEEEEIVEEEEVEEEPEEVEEVVERITR